MFYANSKIAVIASNAKAKSSPRVGSLGFVGETLNRTINCHTTNGAYDAFSTQVVFYRYGFQSNAERLEQKWCQVLVPREFPTRMNPVNFVNKLLKETRSTEMGKGALTIVAVPTPVQAPCSFHETIASVSASLRGYHFKNSLIAFTNGDYQSDRLRKKYKAFQGSGATALRQLVLGNISRKKLPELMHNTKEHDLQTLNDFLFILNTLRSLHIKYENDLLLKYNTPFSMTRYLSAEAKIFATMFQDFVFEGRTEGYEWFKEVKEAYKDKAKQLIPDY